MKTLNLIATIIIMITIVAAKNAGSENPNETGIQFNKSSFKEILALAKKEGKPVFLDISASWCGHCKRMKANVFTDSEVANYFNSKFINVAVDGEVGEGVELAKKYKISGYPTLIFLSSKGETIKQIAGYQNVKEFLETAKSIE